MSNKLNFSKNQLFDTFRTVESNGVEWLVVKGVPLVEGVLNGRFVSADEFGIFTNDWNDIPIVLRHPKKNGGSARVPATDVPIVGRFYNAKMDGRRLTGEYWLDKKMLENSDEGVQLLDLIGNRRPVETSTGYWSESIPQVGKFNDRDYGLIDRNIHPDHIALLPDEIGACSLADGCGMNRNCVGCSSAPASMDQNAADGSYEKRLQTIEQTFYQVMTDREKRAVNPVPYMTQGAYSLQAVFDDHVIFQVGNRLYKCPYSIAPDGQVYFDDDRHYVPVKRVEKYVEDLPADSEVIRNVTGSLPAEGKKIYESVYQSYKDKGLSDEESAKRAWGAVKKAGWKQDKDGTWMKSNHYGPGPHKTGTTQEEAHGQGQSGKGGGYKVPEKSRADLETERIRNKYSKMSNKGLNSDWKEYTGRVEGYITKVKNAGRVFTGQESTIISSYLDNMREMAPEIYKRDKAYGAKAKREFERLRREFIDGNSGYWKNQEQDEADLVTVLFLAEELN